MHPAFALVLTKLASLRTEATRLEDAERSVHVDLVGAGGETSIFVATNSRAAAIESIYTGIEGILKELLACVDEPIYSRKGEDQHRWHAQLLAQAAQATENRPALVSPDLMADLDELRRFRHLDRNIYGHQLDPARVGQLVAVALTVTKRIDVATTSFMETMSARWTNRQ